MKAFISTCFIVTLIPLAAVVGFVHRVSAFACTALSKVATRAYLWSEK